ncbi:unnamed protein product [Leptidea sinapis]|uniref:MARVEL domain-containing protein n=1 Tax=Leptidea sinapis TaxID=189913 RepID=A0A5E4PUX3_9NEOP|nr:unnamed protein product [Leptidea sinapis]
MAEAGFPGQHTTTTTVTSNTMVNTRLRFDPSYLKTMPGVLKVVQTVLCLVGVICIVSSRLSNPGRDGYFIWTTMLAFWFTAILLVFYLFHIVEKFYKIPWLKMEFVLTSAWTLLILVAAILAVTVSDDAHIAGAVFAFVVTVAYGIDAYIKLRGVQAGGLAQGTRVISTQTTEVTAATPRF